MQRKATKNKIKKFTPEQLNIMTRRGKNIRSLRNAKNMSQDKLAEIVGYDSGSSMISQIENAQTEISPKKLRQIAKFFKVDPWVLDGDFTSEQIRILQAVFEKLFIEGKKFVNYNAVLKLLDVKD